MKRFFQALALLFALFSLLSVPASVPAGEGSRAAEAGNRFALDLYGKLSSGKENLFFSPHSIHVALAMTLAGARGETAEEMAKTLHLAAGEGDVHGDFAALRKSLSEGKRVSGRLLYNLIVANALWGQKGYPFQEDYLKVIKSSYGGELSPVDFAGAAGAARKEINDWVEKRTAGKIRDLIPEGVLRLDTRLVLTNAIYFKSAWGKEFSKRMTRDEPFHLEDGGSVRAAMMHITYPFGYFEGEDFQAAELPYLYGSLSMVVLLPRNVDGLRVLEKQLNSASLTRWLSGLQRRELDLSLPRFRVTAAFNLSGILKALGMARAFDLYRADFSGISAAEKLFLQEGLHKAYVDVNEEGTEAAAATEVPAAPSTPKPEPEPPVVFKADHPFLFLIRHESTGAILFLGRILDPGKGGNGSLDVGWKDRRTLWPLLGALGLLTVVALCFIWRFSARRKS